MGVSGVKDMNQLTCSECPFPAWVRPGVPVLDRSGVEGEVRVVQMNDAGVSVWVRVGGELEIHALDNFLGVFRAKASL